MDVLHCLEAAERPVCLLKLEMRDDGERWLRLEPEIYTGRNLASRVGIDIDRPPGPNITRALDAVAFRRAESWQEDAEAIRATLALERAGANARAALAPIEALQRTNYGSDSATFPLLEIVEDAHDGAPGGGEVNPDLGRAAADLLEKRMATQPLGSQGDEVEQYEKDLLRWSDRAAAARIERLRQLPASDPPLSREIDRIHGLVIFGRLEEAASAALQPGPRPKPVDFSDFEVMQTQLEVAHASLEGGRPDLALILLRRLLEEEVANHSASDDLGLLLEDETRLMIRLAPREETTRWLETIEAMAVPSADQRAVEAARAAFYGWRAVGHPDRAHRILKAWRSQSTVGGPEYIFEPKGAVADMLAEEGHLGEAWALIPDAKILLAFDMMNGRDVRNVAAWLAMAPNADARLSALAVCANNDVHAAELRLDCIMRLEAAATTPRAAMTATSEAISAIARGGRSMSDVQIGAAFDIAARLLHRAIAGDPALARFGLFSADVRTAALREIDRADLAKPRAS